MKKIALFLLLQMVLIGSKSAMAQLSADDVFKTKVPVTWLGIDFSEVRFIGPASGWGEVSTKSPTEMRDNYFPAWNNLIANEPKNFRVEEAVSRPSVEYAIEVTAKANEKSNKKEIFSESISDYQLLKEDDIKAMVKKYDFKGKTGLGFCLIAEGMSKGREEASFWVTFVDMDSKKVLYTKRVTGKAGGFGFRNYWAGSVKSVFKTMKKDFLKWD
ncbi:MAG: hypothetical protein JNJ58_01290 [Chitinophagaceae bacterium]|nr:hypothetical protein [Chitinophagaceae bacterium]